MVMGFSMYKRPHHQRVAAVLAGMNAPLLRDAQCYFGGGTAIALQLDEYRESVDMDFLCADQAGYRKLRDSIFDNGLADLFPNGIAVLREVRADRDGIRAILAANGIPIKFEIVREARIELNGTDIPSIPVPCLTKSDLFAEKLLANADRFMDRSTMSRDIIDLLVMEERWGPIPQEAWEKASTAYGDSVRHAFLKAGKLLADNPAYLRECLAKMGVEEAVGIRLQKTLSASHSAISP